MAIPQGPVCEVRPLVVHRYPQGVQKPGSTPCAVAFLGRRGKSVKTMRLIPAYKAFAFARKLQGTPGFTISGSKPVAIKGSAESDNGPGRHSSLHILKQR